MVSKSMRSVFVQIVPRTMGLGIYWGAAQFVRWGLKWRMRATQNVPVFWVRNSVALGTFEPGLSDIDYSLFFWKEPDPRTLSHLILFVNALKKWFVPLLGEANIYVQDDLDLLEDIINPWELDRDPRLTRLFSIPHKERRTQIRAALFLFRMLEADYLNLRNIAELRKRKWRSHFDAINSNFSWFPTGAAFDENPGKWYVEIIVEHILRLAGIHSEQEREEVKNNLVIYLELYTSSMERWKIAYLFRNNAWWWAFASTHFCVEANPAPALDGSQKDVFLAQIEWELFGLLSQYRLNDDKVSVDNHLKSVAHLLDAQMWEDHDFISRIVKLRSVIDRLSSRVVATEKRTTQVSAYAGM